MAGALAPPPLFRKSVSLPAGESVWPLGFTFRQPRHDGLMRTQFRGLLQSDQILNGILQCR